MSVKKPLTSIRTMAVLSCLWIQFFCGIPYLQAQSADIYMLGGDNDEILKLNKQGNLTTVLTATAGSKFNGIAVDEKNNFYTVETKGNSARILKNGKQIKKFSGKATEIAVAPNGEIQLINGQNGKKRKLDNKGKLGTVAALAALNETSQFNGLGATIDGDLYTVEIANNVTTVLKNGTKIKSFPGTINNLAVGPKKTKK